MVMIGKAFIGPDARASARNAGPAMSWFSTKFSIGWLEVEDGRLFTVLLYLALSMAFKRPENTPTFPRYCHGR